MSENFGTTQPNHPVQKDDTQPIKPIKKSRWKSVVFGILGFILLIGLGGFAGYSSGIGARRSAENAILAQQLTEQFSFALVDIQFGRYDNARQRLEYIISKDPNFPGVQQQLTEVLVLSTIPTPTAAPTATATADFSGAESAFARAQELVRAQDWPGALTALDTVRKLDPSYKTAQVDGMYYFALRNYGNNLIVQEGNLEGGIYYLTLAERFGPLDNNSIGLRDGARAYITGASFWELDWEQAADYFSQVAVGWPSMYDGTMTAGQRYFTALVSWGDEVYAKQDYCGAFDIYEKASSVGALSEPSASNYANSQSQCFPATSAPTEAPTAETPTEAPTAETPTEAPAETPTP